MVPYGLPVSCQIPNLSFIDRLGYTGRCWGCHRSAQRIRCAGCKGGSSRNSGREVPAAKLPVILLYGRWTTLRSRSAQLWPPATPRLRALTTVSNQRLSTLITSYFNLKFAPCKNYTLSHRILPARDRLCIDSSSKRFGPLSLYITVAPERLLLH